MTLLILFICNNQHLILESKMPCLLVFFFHLVFFSNLQKLKGLYLSLVWHHFTKITFFQFKISRDNENPSLHISVVSIPKKYMCLYPVQSWNLISCFDKQSRFIVWLIHYYNITVKIMVLLTQCSVYIPLISIFKSKYLCAVFPIKNDVILLIITQKCYKPLETSKYNI